MSERHVLMAIELGHDAARIRNTWLEARSDKSLLMLEWVEDEYFACYGRYTPLEESATPENQAEDDSENSLLPDSDEIMNDYLRETGIVPGSDDEPMDWYEQVGRLIEDAEREVPVSRGEIRMEDTRMLRRQEDFRKAARKVTKHLAEMPVVRKVVLFGSVAMPLWKEVANYSRARFRRRGIKVFHECRNIDMAVWVSSADQVEVMRKAAGRTVWELNEDDTYLSVAHHHFSVHLVDEKSGEYLGMVCHFNKCPKRKPECCVPGCGRDAFVRILPGFRLRPERLNSHSSQVLFARDGAG